MPLIVAVGPRKGEEGLLPERLAGRLSAPPLPEPPRLSLGCA